MPDLTRKPTHRLLNTLREGRRVLADQQRSSTRKPANAARAAATEQFLANIIAELNRRGVPMP